MVVVGVAGFPVGKDDGFRAELPDHGGETQLVLTGGLNVGVGDAEGAAPFDREELGGFSGFFGADLRGTARAHFAGG